METIGIVFGLCSLIVFVLSGMPIFVGLGLSGAIGSLFYTDFYTLMESGNIIWDGLTKYSLLAIPGFVLMGNLFFQHGFGNELFTAADKWIGRIQGGLLLATTLMGAMFGFICGTAAAGAATVGAIAIPEVQKRHYDKRLSLGSFAIAGTLSVLIPPSVLMIIYASLTEVSLGHLFFAGIMPGFLLTFLIGTYIYIRAFLNPKLCPSLTTHYSWKEKLTSLKGVIPIAVTFILVFGGIYLGLWSAVEAAAAGSVLSFLICVVYKRITLDRIKKSMYTTLRLCTMIYMIVMAAGFLNNFVFLSKFDEKLTGLVTGTGLPGWVVIVLILLIMTVLGCVFDVIALIMVSVPIFLPIVVAIGYDPVWFGIVIIVASELALITPPVGVNLFVIKDIAPEGTTTMDVTMGVLPYVFVIWVLFAFLIAFPEIALWLPSTMRGR